MSARPSLGAFYAVVAYVYWGVATLFWEFFFEGAPAVELLAWRILSTAAFLSAVHTLRRTWRQVLGLARHRGEAIRTVLRALCIACNWGLFVWAVLSSQVVAVSLGYFVSPLAMVLIGMVALGERLRVWQWTAVVLAAAGVLRIAIGAGGLPWLALGIAFSFALYALIRKRSEATPVAGLTLELAVLALPALLVVVVRSNQIAGAATPAAGLATGLVLAGAVTAFPLLLFAAATRLADLAVVGFAQYVTPTIMFLIGVGVFDEPVSASLMQGFVAIWAALALFTVEGLMAYRSALSARATDRRARAAHPAPELR